MKAFGKLDLTSPLPLRGFETYFGIRAREGSEAWVSSYLSVQRMLTHLARFGKSEASRESYCNLLKRFCIRTGYNPDQLSRLSKEHIEILTQTYVARAVACVSV